ncbi:unnamed protein product, partial [Meganyctiphanes norvegica]
YAVCSTWRQSYSLQCNTVMNNLIRGGQRAQQIFEGQDTSKTKNTIQPPKHQEPHNKGAHFSGLLLEADVSLTTTKNGIAMGSTLQSKETGRNWHKDTERTKGKCKVSLWTRPVEFADSTIVEADAASLFSSSTSISENIQYMTSHWALVFYWEEQLKDEDGDSIFPRTVSYQAFRINDQLIPTWDDGAPEEPTWKWFPLGELVLSPKNINKAAENLKCNRREYCPMKMNCQRWAKDLWNELKGEVMNIPDSTSFLPIIEYIKLHMGNVLGFRIGDI